MMYEELVKRLRDISNNDSNIKSNYIGLTMIQAADAIEERDRYALTLQHEMMAEAESHIALVERLNKRIEELELHYCPHAIRNVHDRGDDSLCRKYGCEVNALPRWIPVTERLPGSGVHVLAACRVKYVGGGGRSYVCDAFYSGHFKEQRSTEYDDIELDYDEETDEYYLPEGWWEVIRNWDEYGFVGIADFVTHWMPLPEPPKEEA